MLVQIADRLGVSAQEVSNVVIWGNHSSTQFPDASKGLVNINGQSVPVLDALKDDAWLKNDFITVRLIEYMCGRSNFKLCER